MNFIQPSRCAGRAALLLAMVGLLPACGGGHDSSSSLSAQTIRFTNPGSLTLGTAAPALVASATSGLTLTVRLDAPPVGGLAGRAFNLVNTDNRASVFFGFGGEQGASAASFDFDDLTLLPWARPCPAQRGRAVDGPRHSLLSSNGVVPAGCWLTWAGVGTLASPTTKECHDLPRSPRPAAH